MYRRILTTLIGFLPFAGAYAQLTPVQITFDNSLGVARPFGLTIFDNKLLFAAGTPGPFIEKTWFYNETSVTAGSIFQGMMTISPHPGPMPVVNGKYYVIADSSSTNNDYSQLYYSTGSGPFTKVPHSGWRVSDEHNFIAWNNRLYYVAFDIPSATNPTLFYLDANNNINTAFALSSVQLNGNPLTNITDLVIYNNKIYFVGSNYFSEIFSYDPSNSSITQVPTVCIGCNIDGSVPKNLHVGDNGKLYYSAIHAAEGRELYEFSGTGSPVKLTSLNGTQDGVEVNNQTLGHDYSKSILKLGSNIYFSGNNTSNGYEIMKYDLTSNTATLVKDLYPGSSSSSPKLMISFAGKVYFIASTPSEGSELWSTDGTAAGTNLVADLMPGVGSSEITNLAIYNNRLYISAHGYNVYRLGNPLGIEAVVKTRGINVYPVPASDIVNFNIDLINGETLSIILTDMTGKKVYRSSGQKFNTGMATVTVPVKELPAGTYTYTICSESGETIGTGKLSR